MDLLRGFVLRATTVGVSALVACSSSPTLVAVVDTGGVAHSGTYSSAPARVAEGLALMRLEALRASVARDLKCEEGIHVVDDSPLDGERRVTVIQGCGRQVAYLEACTASAADGVEVRACDERLLPAGGMAGARGSNPGGGK